MGTMRGREHGKVELTVNGTVGTLIVDGTDISSIARYVQIGYQAGRMPEITIDLIPKELMVNIDNAEIVTWYTGGDDTYTVSSKPLTITGEDDTE